MSGQYFEPGRPMDEMWGEFLEDVAAIDHGEDRAQFIERMRAEMQEMGLGKSRRIFEQAIEQLSAAHDRAAADWLANHPSTSATQRLLSAQLNTA
jgi:hypothetical protein